jgi:hypothetical protein
MGLKVLDQRAEIRGKLRRGRCDREAGQEQSRHGPDE